jgi:hypothetical protein
VSRGLTGRSCRGRLVGNRRRKSGARLKCARTPASPRTPRRRR